MAGLAVGAVQLDARAPVLSSGAPRPRCADPRHRPRLAGQPDGLAQRDARGGPRLTVTVDSKVGGSVRPGQLVPRDGGELTPCLLYTSPSPRDGLLSRMPSSA